jgi:hypothetical protein
MDKFMYVGLMSVIVYGSGFRSVFTGFVYRPVRQTLKNMCCIRNPSNITTRNKEKYQYMWKSFFATKE